MLKFWRVLWLFSILFGGMAACRYFPAVPEIPQVVTAEPSSTPAICTEWPEGMKVRLMPKPNASIIMELEGFQLGEPLIFLFTGEIPGKSSARLESRPAASVGADGRFTWDVSLYTTPQINQWQGKIIHARGVACFELTLPLPNTPLEFPPSATATPIPSATPELSPTTTIPPDEPVTPPPPPQVNCPDPQTDEMVGTFVENGPNSIYTNPVLGIEITLAGKLCVHEPDYLSTSYGFTLADPDVWEGVLFSANWLYQAAPNQLETIVQQTIDSFPELEINRETIAVDGIPGVMLWPLPGTDTTTQIYLAAQNRLYHLIFWSAPLDDRAQTLLDGLRFVEPTQSLDSLNLPSADSSASDLSTAVPTNPSPIQTGAPLLFIRDNDLWRASLNGQNEQRLTEGELLADWGIDKLPAYDPWWMGGFPPQVHVSPDGRWLAFTQTGRNLVLVDVTGAEPPRFHKLEGWSMVFAWAPDSQRLAYSIQPHFMLTRNQAGIYTYDVVTGSLERLLSQDGGNLVWSPDSRFLAFSCCFSESQPGPYEFTNKGEVRQVELATKNVTAAGETWIGVASGPPPLCWSADGAVGIDVADPVVCSHERPYPSAISPDGQQTAVLSLRTPDDEELFHLLLVQNQNDGEVLWQQEIPLAQTAAWSPDGQWLLLSHNFFTAAPAIYRLPADGSGQAQPLLPDALLLDMVAAWQ